MLIQSKKVNNKRHIMNIKLKKKQDIKIWESRLVYNQNQKISPKDILITNNNNIQRKKLKINQNVLFNL